MKKLLLWLAFLLFFHGGINSAYAEEIGGIRLVFGGDVTLASWYGTLAGSNDPAWPFLKLRPYFMTADLVMVNCETAITDRGVIQPKEFNFRMKPELVAAFTQNGISLVTIANNHVCDYGKVGLEDTISYLDRAGIGHVGAGMNLTEARKPVWRMIKGKRFAFLAYGNYSSATADRYGVAYRDPSYVVADIRSAKKMGADYVVVNFHWGAERAKSPSLSDKGIAHAAVDAGADIVVGHHPHVLQPVEIYRGKIIAYSLGNFVFGGNRNPGKDSALLEVTVTDSYIDYRLVPIRIDVAETRYQPYIIDMSKSGLATR
ncbi:MAG: CapA family protein [Candidatus Moranbacteria bacterium]|nr:CapA family protein [Candidatus Moranbacteria bacterium]